MARYSAAMENKITLRHACVAYLAAVTATAACGSFILVALEGALLSAVVPFFGIAWLCASVGGLLPFTIAIYFANRLNIRSWAYFAGVGTVAALATSLLVMGENAFACGEEENPFEMLNLCLHLAASGAAGGTACWAALRIQARLDTRVRMS